MNSEKSKRILCGLLASGGFLSSLAKAGNEPVCPVQEQKNYSWDVENNNKVNDGNADGTSASLLLGHQDEMKSYGTSSSTGDYKKTGSAPRINVGNVTLRALREDDMEKLLPLFTKNVYRNMSQQGRDVDEFSDAVRLHMMIERGGNGWDSFPYVIEENHSRMPVGVVQVFFHPEKGLAKLRYWVGEKHWNKGYASSCMKALAPRLASQKVVRRIGLRIFDDNNASRRIKDKIFNSVRESVPDHMFSEYLIPESNGLVTSYYLKKCNFDENSWNEIWQDGYLMFGEKAETVVQQAEKLLANGEKIGLSGSDIDRLSKQINMIHEIIDGSPERIKISYVVASAQTGFPLGTIILSFSKDSEADLFCITDGKEMSHACLALAKDVILGSKVKNVKLHCKSADSDTFTKDLQSFLSNDLDNRLLSLSVTSEDEKSVPVLSRYLDQSDESIKKSESSNDKKEEEVEKKEKEEEKKEEPSKEENVTLSESASDETEKNISR